MMPVLALVAAYLIGAIPFGYLLLNWTTGAATLLHDIAKRYIAVWLAAVEPSGISKAEPVSQG